MYPPINLNHQNTEENQYLIIQIMTITITIYLHQLIFLTLLIFNYLCLYILLPSSHNYSMMHLILKTDLNQNSNVVLLQYDTIRNDLVSIKYYMFFHAIQNDFIPIIILFVKLFLYPPNIHIYINLFYFQLMKLIQIKINFYLLHQLLSYIQYT